MSREPFQPDAGQISLSALYDALSDPVRRMIVGLLAEQGELTCSSFLQFGSKTGISYHLARLREAGITYTRIDGNLRCLKLREADLEQRFPGLLPAVIASVRAEAGAAGPHKADASVKTAAVKPAAIKPAAVKPAAVHATKGKAAQAAPRNPANKTSPPRKAVPRKTARAGSTH